ncbi:MAG: helix-turn-helix domain-containing protein [Kiritimatiellae bacterium]|nr:helix-turn-helix domain-containing protein [Kiritimatiellia bacterium]
MSSFGETLRAAREAKGLSCSQVAAQTHMLVQIVEEMEREDFHRIPAPIYGRGFVRLFVDCVGLDPVPLVREFMEIYEGRRAPTVSIREVPTAPVPPPVQPTWQTPQDPQPEPEPFVPPAPEPEPFVPPTPEPEPFVPTPEPEPIVPPTPEPAPVPTYQPRPEPAVQPDPAPVQKPPQVVRGLELVEQAPDKPFSDDMPLFAQPQEPVQRPEPPQIDPDSPFLPAYDDGEASAADRFKKGLSEVSSRILKKVRDIPRRVWRTTALLLCAVLAIVFIVWSIGKLYKATSIPTETQPAAVLPTPAGQTADANAETAPKSQSKPNQAKPTSKAEPPAKPTKLISTGQNVPNLIRD